LEDIAGVAPEYPVAWSGAKALDDGQEFRWLADLSQFGGALPCGAFSGGSDTATPLALSDNQANDESSLFSRSATAKFKISH